MFEKLSDNLNQLMAEIHISSDELARQTGLPASTIKKIRNRFNLNPTLATLMPLAQFFSLTLGQLVGEEPLPIVRLKSSPPKTLNTLHHIPQLSWAEAILWPTSDIRPDVMLATEFKHSEHAFALSVEEDGLENLSKGTLLLIDPALTAEHRDFIIVHKEGQQQPTLKQILMDEGQMYLKPLVNGYNITTLTPEHKIIGVVTGIKKYLRSLPSSPADIMEVI